MIEAVKMAARISALVALALASAVLMSSLVPLLTGISGIGWIVQGMGIAVAFVSHWWGETNAAALMTATSALISIEVALLVYKGVLVVQKFLLRASEG